MNFENSNLDLVSIEKKHLSRWEEINLFDKINKKGKSSKREWVYYDGPITANGKPHYGHAITWTIKDVFPRFYSMNNYFVSRNIGWDCQGILVEYEIEKQLGFTHKREIEQMGVEKFNNLCRESVLKNRNKMYEYEIRLGRFIDKSDEYSTMDKDYIESMWWALKTLYNKGLLYEGYKVVAYSPRTGMTLSTHEVADGGYKDVEDLAVCVKFKLSGEKNTYFLAWTTTPWTLPGNLLLAIGKKITYVKVAFGDEFYILAKERVSEIFKNKEYKIVETLLAKNLVDTVYEPLFSYYKNKKTEGCFRIVYGNHVNTTDGTGIVHLAPYGEEDFNIFQEKKITIFDYLNETGEFTSEIKDFEGLFYKKANTLIAERLEKEDKLFFSEKYLHSMPVDYRSGTPLIYKPIKSWYVNISKIKDKLVSEAKKINFVPDTMGSGRFVPWIENARDWSLSRLRFWGTPLPIWKNDKTGEIVVIGSFEELSKISGKKLSKNFDPHKPFVDEIEWVDSKSGGVFKRLPEVIDVWFDSGSMPFARYNYPFENKEKFETRFPAEYISEGDDQLRLWFYTMFVLGVALFDKTPYKNVIVIGMLGDESGKKMSKSKGNYPPIEEVFEKYGSDSFRYFLLTSQVVRAEPASFSYKALDEVKKEFLTICWNSYRYYATYAQIFDFKPKKELSQNNILDKWILSVFESAKSRIIKNIENYEIMFAAREFAPLMQNISTWYIRRSRDRISSGDKDALNTLHYVLREFSILLAPFLPFLSNELYLQLTQNKEKESVHLEDYPKVISKYINSDLEKNMLRVKDVCSLANAIRKEINIPVKQPLSTLFVLAEFLNSEFSELIKDEINVKNVEFIKSKKDIKVTQNLFNREDRVFLDTNLTPELKLEGDFRSLVRVLMDLRKENGVKIGEKVKFMVEKNSDYKKVLDKFYNELLSRVDASKIILGDETKIV